MNQTAKQIKKNKKKLAFSRKEVPSCLILCDAGTIFFLPSTSASYRSVKRANVAGGRHCFHPVRSERFDPRVCVAASCTL